MRDYYETGSETTEDFARVDVTDLTEEEKEDTITDLQALFPGQPIRLHHCYHDETPEKPCTLAIIA